MIGANDIPIADAESGGGPNVEFFGGRPLAAFDFQSQFPVGHASGRLVAGQPRETRYSPSPPVGCRFAPKGLRSNMISIIPGYMAGPAQRASMDGQGQIVQGEIGDQVACRYRCRPP